MYTTLAHHTRFTHLKAHNMKYAIVLLLLFFSISLLAQYPDGGRKSRLGYATTGDGLIVQGDGAPNYTPSSLKNAYTYVDTTNNRVFYFAQGTVSIP